MDVKNIIACVLLVSPSTRWSTPFSTFQTRCNNCARDSGSTTSAKKVDGQETIACRIYSMVALTSRGASPECAQSPVSAPKARKSKKDEKKESMCCMGSMLVWVCFSRLATMDPPLALQRSFLVEEAIKKGREKRKRTRKSNID